MFFDGRNWNTFAKSNDPWLSFSVEDFFIVHFHTKYLIFGKVIIWGMTFWFYNIPQQRSTCHVRIVNTIMEIVIPAIYFSLHTYKTMNYGLFTFMKPCLTLPLFYYKIIQSIPLGKLLPLGSLRINFCPSSVAFHCHWIGGEWEVPMGSYKLVSHLNSCTLFWIWAATLHLSNNPSSGDFKKRSQVSIFIWLRKQQVTSHLLHLKYKYVEDGTIWVIVDFEEMTIQFYWKGLCN